MLENVEQSRFRDQLIGDTIAQKLDSCVKEVWYYKKLAKEYEKAVTESEKDKKVFRDILTKVLDEVDFGRC